jgi:hypothetical protein
MEDDFFILYHGLSLVIFSMSMVQGVKIFKAGSIRAGGCLVLGTIAGVKASASNRKGGSHVVDDCCSNGHFVALGIGERLYDGQFHSYPVGRCHCDDTDQSDQRAKTSVMYAGEGYA